MRAKCLCLIATLLITSVGVSSTCAYAQMGGMGGMGGMGRGGRGNSNSNQEPEQPPAPPPPKPNPFADDATPVEGLRQRTAVLEKFILGRIQSGQKIDKRVLRLEKKLVPYEHHEHQNSSQDLDKRVDHLWSLMSNANKANSTGKVDSADKPEKDSKDADKADKDDKKKR